LEFFGDAADYLLIENSARFKSDSFKATPPYDQFVARNSPTLVVPRISAGTLNAWEASTQLFRSVKPVSLSRGLDAPGYKRRIAEACYRSGLPIARLSKIEDYVRAHLAESISIEMLADLSPFHFSRVFKQTTGMPPLQFVTRERMLQAL
jgi:hypothetical protein